MVPARPALYSNTVLRADGSTTQGETVYVNKYNGPCWPAMPVIAVSEMASDKGHICRQVDLNQW